jgi:hypothetical protein
MRREAYLLLPSRRVRTLVALTIVVCLPGCDKLLGIGDPKPGDRPDGAGGDDGGPTIDSSPPCVTAATFLPEQSFAIGATGTALAIAQLDRVIGRDVAIAVGDGVQLMLGDNAGSFGSGMKIPAPTGIQVDRLVIDDFDNDGDSDLVVWGDAGTGIAEIRQDRTTNPPTYLTPQPLTGPFTGLQAVVAGYLDGAVLVADLLVKDSGGARVYTSSLGTLGTFIPYSSTVPGIVGNDTLAAVEDLNGAGNDDAVFVSAAGEVKIVLDAPTFGTTKTVGSGVRERWVGIGNLDGDTSLDLIVGTGEGGVIYRGDGAGTFTQVPGTIASVTGASIQVIDVNGDGKADLVLPNRLVYQCAPATTGGPGVFSQFDPLEGGGPALFADVTGDGKPDLLRIVGTELRVRVQQ